MLYKISYALLLLLFALQSFSQSTLETKDTTLLPEVEVKGKLLRGDFVGDRTTTWEKEAIEQSGNTNLATLLGQESGIYIKSYGGGGAATSSVRGGSAGHTTVLWNGLPLQSPMLGLLDLSQIPLSFVDEVGLRYGGNTAAWGSGTIGGLIALDNKSPENTSLSVHSTIGSFGFFDQQLKAQYFKKKWKGSSRIFYRQADNDFKYRLRPDLPEKQQVHAAMQQKGFLQEVYWQPDPQQQFSLYIWGQQSNQDIPPTTVQTRSEATQVDRFLRTSLQWKAIRKRMVWQARTALFREHLDYRDDQILLESFSSFWTAIGELEGTWHLNEKQRLHFGISHTWLQAEIDAYAAPPQQNRTALFTSFRQTLRNWHIQLNLRQELVDREFIPTVPSLGLEGVITSWLKLKAKWSRNYRLATFNDLYWQPGGNPDLLPESGWSQEMSLLGQWGSEVQRWQYSITGFSRNIDNWILWSVVEGQIFWSPRNLSKVWSRGIEQRLSWSYHKGDWQAKLSLGYDYIRSTNEVALSTPKLKEGEQLVYVPRHKAFGSLGLQWKTLKLSYRQVYTGHVSSVSNGELPDYQLGYLSLSYVYKRPKFASRLFLHLNNLWDTDYRVIERRVMPGRNIQIGLQFTFHKK